MKKVLGVIFSVFVLLSVHTQPTGTTPVEAVCTCGVDCNNNFNIYYGDGDGGLPICHFQCQGDPGDCDACIAECCQKSCNVEGCDYCLFN
jgi:hypothetical protein